ncbi:hypothetical protein [Nocardia rhizosphaerihabitans]|uniref:Uncharacterized protein n=1 Tax=Nocardia rhizosphaerihabitans TaxID=1691570 RepID=A0ABQ2KF08_9NOCA|nr:hypothetical protein [Nocardia rhizosphaerihabitans]GGN79203.1 hypothetical protein GCM10011610_27410 [Nocardia rhizosphaerihabitans]
MSTTGRSRSGHLTAVWLTDFGYGSGSEPRGQPHVESGRAFGSQRATDRVPHAVPTSVINDASAAGKTWAEISAALGMSAQGAIDHHQHQRELIADQADGARDRASSDPMIALALDEPVRRRENG